MKSTILKLRLGFFISLILVQTQVIFSQNTIGILKNDSEQVYAGYNLLYPHNQPHIFLLDNCGQLVHTWEDEASFRPGNAAYILENGNLIKCKRAFNATVQDRIWAGGGGATVELRTWENELLSSFTLNDDQARLHHDIAPLPNGNILMIAWELRDSLTAIRAGRNPDLLPNGELWSEMVLEWNPFLDTIVWEWHVWDHTIQDFNSRENQLQNFGTIANHPELIDVNYDEHDGHPDWLHINAIDYNPVLDQLVLSVPYFNEFWIVDHSTTTQEAKGHIGGNSGKGGDLLYRWGNPAAYQQGTIMDKKCFFQHDVHWVNPKATSDDPDFGVLAFYNNRVGTDFATINSVKASFDSNSQSYLAEEQLFLPTDYLSTFVYPDTEDIRAFSNSLSSVQYLPNGNVLALAGRYGFAYELNPNQEIVWSYIVPIKAGAFVSQGETLERNDNVIFRMERYSIDFDGFIGRDLRPTSYLELSPNTEFCGQLVSSNELVKINKEISIYPNPTSQYINVNLGEDKSQFLSIYNINGQLIDRFITGQQEIINVQHLPKGLYFLETEKGRRSKLIISY